MKRPVAVDWAEVQAEVVDTLQAYLRIDTTNPPGGEEAAARFLGAILEREGLTPEYFDAGAGRVSLRTALRGDGSRAPLMLLNHTDVVPAEAEHWQVGPFDGAVRDGCLWGRGSLDMKGMGILELLVLLVAKRTQLPLKRDLIFLALADEETGGSKGVEFLDRERPDLLREPEYCLNEGGIATLEFLGAKPPSSPAVRPKRVRSGSGCGPAAPPATGRSRMRRTRQRAWCARSTLSRDGSAPRPYSLSHNPFWTRSNAQALGPTARPASTPSAVLIQVSPPWLPTLSLSPR